MCRCKVSDDIAVSAQDGEDDGASQDDEQRFGNGLKALRSGSRLGDIPDVPVQPQDPVKRKGSEIYD